MRAGYTTVNIQFWLRSEKTLMVEKSQLFCPMGKEILLANGMGGTKGRRNF